MFRDFGLPSDEDNEENEGDEANEEEEERRMGVSTKAGLSRMRVSRTGVSTGMGPSTGSYF
jgi:hypothetical protein